MFAWLATLRDTAAPFYGEAEFRLLKHLCDPAGTAFDIGANSGTYTHRLARLAARVIAFEPNPHLAEVLDTRFRSLIAAGSVRIERCALSDEAGSAELFVPRRASALASVEWQPGAEGGLEGETVRVRRARLDDWSAETVGLIKVDVEGHELAVLRGGLGLIGRDRPNLLVEAEERHHPGTLDALKALLLPMGYRGFYLHNGLLRSMDRFDPAVLQSRDALNAEGTFRLKGRTYINNFLFVARPGIVERIRADLERR
ncbi:FkbM family methyltransferase [Arenibaculum pallidiluteum]|uniref:FkbM family methyltransferase n=1 Tax=Arenibaculum pallidiluteum TaxID=2812559 RepID=UPI002E2BDA83|nr:FkbM family methyltransferase [Arenibaculum pallidiluteum]